MFSANSSQVSNAANYIEDVFSAYLYTGTSATQTITNGIDLAGKGGFVWIKSRSAASQDGRNQLFDTARGITYRLISDSTAAQTGPFDNSLVYNLSSTGFTVGNGAAVNYTGENFVSWTFRKQPKFFDVVTYTGNGTGQTISHNLGSVPGCIIIKEVSGGASAGVTNWAVYHRSLGNTDFAWLNSTAAKQTSSGYWNNTSPTSTAFTVGSTGNVNESGGSFVAYLFAHDAGGFGLTGTDNVISCGAYTGNGSAQTISLGYEPQWVMIKSSSLTDTNWTIFDSMRGIVTATGVSGDAALVPNTSNAEVATDALSVTATGFTAETNATHYNRSGQTYIYIAIRRGPMKVPTSGTSVFYPFYSGSFPDPATMTSGWPVDAGWALGQYTNGSDSKFIASRLTGGNALVPSSTAAEVAKTLTWDLPTALKATGLSIYGTSTGYLFRRAPNFMDVVCYTGTGGTGSRSLSHNLQAVPELVILKSRSGVANWQTGSMFTSTTVTRAVLNRNDDQDLNSLYSGQSIWGGQPTASTFLIDASGSFNTSAATYVAYLFATCAGVSKVGSYTGTGTTQQINCGFTGGARFVLIRRANSTGDWYVWDSARGIVSGNDPYLLLNSTAPQNTGTDYIDPYSAGFEISSTAPAAINASGGTFIFLAIA